MLFFVCYQPFYSLCPFQAQRASDMASTSARQMRRTGRERMVRVQGCHGGTQGACAGWSGHGPNDVWLESGLRIRRRD